MCMDALYSLSNITLLVHELFPKSRSYHINLQWFILYWPTLRILHTWLLIEAGIWHTLHSYKFSAIPNTSYPTRTFSWTPRPTLFHKVHAYSLCPISDHLVSILVSNFDPEMANRNCKDMAEDSCHMLESSVTAPLLPQSKDWEGKRDQRRAGLGVTNVLKLPLGNEAQTWEKAFRLKGRSKSQCFTWLSSSAEEILRDSPKKYQSKWANSVQEEAVRWRYRTWLFLYISYEQFEDEVGKIHL